MSASATTANSGGKTHSPVSLPMTMSVQQHHHQQQQQQQHHMQAIPSSAAAAAAAAVAAAAQLAAAAQMTNGSGSRLLQAPPPQTSSPHEPLPQTQQTQPLAPLPSWAYGHPALLPVDPQTESLTENWRQFQQAAYNYNLDPHMLAAMYGGGPGAGGGGIGFGQHPLHHHHHHPHHPHHQHPHRSDLSARRKNATRETTSILKAWLNEHKKNPYPTKGEKIMLAIITTMTLTQVSTWFANARRRLKKENKMTWVPRNRPDEDDEDEEEDAPSTTAASGAAAAALDEDNNEDFDEDDDIAIDVGGGGPLDVENNEDDSRPKIPMSIHGHQSFISQRKRPMQQVDETAAKTKADVPTSDDPVAKAAKPRIWSIVDTLNKTEPRHPQPPMLPQTRLQIPQPLPPLPPMPHQFQHHGQHLNQQSAFGFFGHHPKLPMTAGHQCGMQPPPPPPPPPHHQLLLPPLYYSLFNAFNNRPATSAAAAAAFGNSSPEPKCSPALDQPTGI